jgi:stage II sporulation protein D
MMKGVKGVAVGLLIVMAWLAGVAGAQTLVRVLLADVAGVTIEFEGPHRGGLDGRAFETPHGLAWPLRAVGDRLWVDGREAGSTLDLTSDAGIVWNGRRYRGTLRLTARSGAVRVINVLDLESYLRGVVPAEMQASWPTEALKAQAVAARTYTLHHIDGGRDHDVCATVDCQVYRGWDAENPATDAAIAATAGEVLTYEGVFARTFYHADSGGVIASSAEVWGADLPYLQAFQDVANAGPHSVWTARLDARGTGAHLALAGVQIGNLVRLRVLETSLSGRVVRAEVVGSAGRAVLEGALLRTQLRAWGLKSTRFVMTGDLTLRGHGWGHGVGMSQYGARTLALAGHDYAQILGFYYPATVLQRLDHQAARPRPQPVERLTLAGPLA